MRGTPETGSTAADASPFAVWWNRFREDFSFEAGRWFSGLGASLLAIPIQLIGKFPERVGRWGRGLLRGGRYVSGPNEISPGHVQPAFWRRAGRWLVIFLLRTLDLISAGELVNFLEHLVKPNSRPLSEMEISEARRVFGESLSYDRIRVDEWSLIADTGAWVYRRVHKKTKPIDMAVTIYNTIHFTRRLKITPGSNDMGWLIHELTHIAQYDHVGGAFMVEALIAQGEQGYDYGGPSALAGRDLFEFNREQQGEIARDFYRILTKKKAVSDSVRADYSRLISQLAAGEL